VGRRVAEGHEAKHRFSVECRHHRHSDTWEAHTICIRGYLVNDVKVYGDFGQPLQSDLLWLMAGRTFADGS
jgi:hypothetical protein